MAEIESGEAPYKLAVIGAGTAVQMALPTLAQMGPVAICHLDDQTPSGMRDFTQFPNVDTILDAKVAEHVYIATPVSSHLEIARLAASRGLKVLIEKPMFKNVVEAKQIPEELRASITPAFRKRYSSASRAIQRLRKADDARGFQVSYSWLAPHPGVGHWKMNKAVSGGGICMDVASHVFDLFEFLFGSISKIDVVHFALDPNELTDSQVVMEGRFLSSGSFRINIGWGLLHSGQILTYSGSQGDVVWKKFTGESLSELFVLDRESCHSITCERTDEYGPMFSDFMISDKRTEFMPTFDDGLRNLQLLELVNGKIYGE